MAEQSSVVGRIRRGELDLRVDLSLPTGVIAVVGPNGTGKTSVLRTIAGLERITDGQVTLDGELLDDGDRHVVPPEQRDIAFAFQEPRLFPHLSVVRNIAYPLERRGVPRTEAMARAEDVAATIGLGGVLAARPRDLSGGQAQRANIGRALIADAGTVLLDEPLAAIDDRSKDDLRLLFRSAGRQRVVWVTHDPADAEHADHIISIGAPDLDQTGSR